MALTVGPAELVRAAEESGNPGLLGRHESWERVRLADIATIQNGFPFKSHDFNHDGVGMPLVRIRDVGKDQTSTYYTGKWDEEYIVRPGDLIVGMDGDFRVSFWRGQEALLNQRVCKISVRSETHMDVRFLMHSLQGYLDAIAAATSSVTVKHLSSRSINDIPLPLPPLREQHRIVEALEDHLSRLDAARHAVANTSQRVKSLIIRAMGEEFTSIDARLYPLSEVSAVRLGRQRSPKNHSGEHMRPYLRAANVGWNGLILDDVKEMNFTDKEASVYELRPGDIVLSEASGSPGEVGKPALWRGEIEGCCFQNTLIRVRPLQEAEPLFLLHYLRYEALRGAFRNDTRGVGIHHLGAANLSSRQVPLPSREEQLRIVSRIEEQVSRCDRLSATLQGSGSISAHADSLEQALLRHALTGRLVPQDPSDEPASALLARAVEKRASQAKPKRTRRAGAPAKRAAPAPRSSTAELPPAASSAPLPTHAVQQAFDVFQDQDDPQTQDAAQ